MNARPQLKVMKMVEQVKGAFKGMKKIPKVTVFGVHFSVAAQDTGDGIPMLVKRCVSEIESRGVAIKVNAVFLEVFPSQSWALKID